MKRHLITAIIVFSSIAQPLFGTDDAALEAFNVRNDTEQSLPIVPYPAMVVRGDGSFALKELSGFRCMTANDSVRKIVSQFFDDLQKTSGISITEATGGKLATFRENHSLGREDYVINISDAGISVEAAAYGGFFYALGTLRQLLPRSIYTLRADREADWTLPYVSIEDHPQLPVRGFMLDVSRHFFSIGEVKKLIDVASIFKLNRLHWHLTDDQGWRVEIPEYPRLTEVGSIRKASLTIGAAGKGNTFYDDTEYGRGCYYTLSELRDVVSYAKERNVDILPEVDMPGHMVAAIASYPWLSCDSTLRYEVRVNAGISHDVLDVANPRVISFLKTVLGHIADVFPYPYIHIGGDECPTDAWERSADCQVFMREKGLSSVKEMQPWLVEELGTWLQKEKGKGVCVWDDLILKSHWSPQNTVKPVVFCYNTSVDPIPNVSAQGFKIIATESTPMYFDLPQASPAEMEFDAPYIGGYGERWYNTIGMVFEYDPAATAGDSSKLVIGTQASLWTETCCSDKELEYEFFPRLLAVSEMAWKPRQDRRYVSFFRRLQSQQTVLEAKDIYYAPYAFTALPKRKAAAEAAKGSIGITGKPEEGRLYNIVSASTYYRKRYNGSTLYAKGDSLRIHYTPQQEPEEVFSFSETADGRFVIKSLLSGRCIALDSLNAAARLAKDGASPVEIQQCGMPEDVVNIRGDEGLLYAMPSGVVIVGADATLHYPGSWRIKEVSDYAKMLSGLTRKAESIAAKSSSKRLKRFLKLRVVNPANRKVALGSVSKAVYLRFVKLYRIGLKRLGGSEATAF